MREPFSLVWMLEGEEPDAELMQPKPWAQPATGPLESLHDVVAYLVGARWMDSYLPWVRKPDGLILDPLTVIGYLPE